MNHKMLLACENLCGLCHTCLYRQARHAFPHQISAAKKNNLGKHFEAARG